MQHFVDDDRGYLDWLDHHSGGFVINTGRTPSAAYLMLHRASCRTITGKPARGTTFTGEYAKVCGERNELDEFARHLGGHTQPCRLCMPERGQPVPAKTSGGKYGPLREHLSGARGTRVRMTFEAVEDLVGRLPESAYRHRAWWGNNDGNVEAKAWLDAGWRVESVNQADGEVVFTRVTAPAVGRPAADSSKSLKTPRRTAFVSYSQRDERYRQRLDTALAQLRRNELIITWHDRMILPGQEWEREIDKNLDNADIVLLLVSPDFIASDYAYGREMVRALGRHESGSATVIPIILRPCDWKNSPLNSLEALPSKGRAVSSWSNRDEAWLDVTQGLRRIISVLTWATF